MSGSEFENWGQDQAAEDLIIQDLADMPMPRQFPEDEEPEGKWARPVDRCGECGAALREHDGANHKFRPRMGTRRYLMEQVPPDVAIRDAADGFLRAGGIDQPSPDAVGQLTEVFLPCLRIMCDPSHPWDPDGATWRKGGILAVLTDARKKWERFWERTWTHAKRHDDSGLDLINYIAFVMRADPDSRWGDWGEPG
jgi:hypothetical protein